MLANPELSMAALTHHTRLHSAVHLQRQIGNHFCTGGQHASISAAPSTGNDSGAHVRRCFSYLR